MKKRLTTHDNHAGNQQSSGISRRKFIKGAAAGTLGIAAAGILGACTGETASQSTSPAAPDSTASTGASGKYSWETPPTPIPESEITETVETDVLVIGAGMGGLCCGLKAREDGADVIIVEKMASVVGRGGSIFAMNSKFLKEKGYSIDIGTTYKKMLGYHSFRVDEDKWMLHANKSGEAMDWLIDRMTAAGSVGGSDLFPIMEQWYIDPEEIIQEYPGTHEFLGGPNGASPRDNPQQDVVDNLAAYCEDAGVQIVYETFAEQLIKDDSGRVIGVTALSPDKKYIKYLGKKGVVLATGDFGTDTEMIEKYCSWAKDAGPGGVFDGYGHKMALWAGAAWQKTTQAAPMIFCFQWVNITNQVRAFQGLLVNKKGVRYTNEDNVLSHGSLSLMSQPGNCGYAIWDTAYAADADWSVQYVDGPPVFESPQATIDHWDSLVSAGTIDQNGSGALSMNMVKCDTLEELIEQLGLPSEETLATIKKYNEFCESGEDSDWHKRKELLLPVKEPPFYGAICTPWQLTMTGGIRCNTQMQVLNEDDEIVPGLYCVGIMVGDMYANCYSTHFPGHNLGSTCLTFGYLTGQKLAGE